jgi:4-amino-4-deoxy-L-arabinose transferase-like glycosyltransferase
MDNHFQMNPSITEDPCTLGVTRPKGLDPHYCGTVGLFIFCLFIAFSDLGGAALFEPDEGRNAEVAREILLLDDWVTPHYDFIPRLDKPIFFFWLVAFSFKLFGLSEWSARLPSVLAGLGCLSFTYVLARSMFGRWAALWSVLILLTCVEFFALSRIVILDMTLTLFLSLTLAFFWFGHLSAGRSKRALFLLMYAAMGVATLIKGPVGFMLPAGVIFFYLLFSRKWIVLREMEILLGVPVFLLAVGSWYVAVELRNPGYLHHFFWEENLARFATTKFKRSEPWYYFIVVLVAGFVPWTALLPIGIADLRKRPLTDEQLFLILWIALPFFVFSLSASKLPHYILPLYPPLAILVGATIAKAFTDSSAKISWVLSLPATTFFALPSIVVLLIIWPAFLPDQIEAHVHAAFPRTPISLAAGLLVTVVRGVLAVKRGLWRRPLYLYTATAVGFALFILVAEPITAAASRHRSSKQLAEKAALVIREGDQLVLYEKYLSSLPFYLDIQQPMWVVWSGNKSKVLGSDYVAKKRPEPAAGYGKVLYTYEEFANRSLASKNRLVVFIDDGAFDALPTMGGAPRRLLQVNGTSVVTNRRNATRKRNGARTKAPHFTRLPQRLTSH